MRSRRPSPVPADDRNEDVFQRRRNRKHGIEGDGGGGERRLHRGGMKDEVRRPKMDPVSEETHGGGGERLPERRGGLPRLPASDLQKRPPEEGADLLRRPHREELSVVKKSDPAAPFRLVEVGGG